MNKKKYKDLSYNMRQINDLKDMLDSSAVIHSDRTAYLIKEKAGTDYIPVKFWQLKEDVDSLGTALCAMGMAGRKIALIGENSYHWVVTYMATINGTGVIVPIDKELPPGEIESLMNRAGVSVIVYSGKLAKETKEVIQNIEGIECRICMDQDAPQCQEGFYTWDEVAERGRSLIKTGDRSFVDAVIDREAMCTLLFTSGTMGYAKGVMLSHKNISSNVYNLSKYIYIRQPGVGLSVLPMHHTYEMTCHILTAIYQGVCVAICEGLKHIAKNLTESQTTVMLGVPLVFESMHRKIFKQAGAAGKGNNLKFAIAVSKKFKLYNNQKLIRKLFADIHKAAGGHIELFVAGGAAIDPRVIEDFQAMGFPMIQGYGMTENAPIIAVNRDSCSKASSVGYPMPGTEIRIEDPDDGGIGEIICRGPSVMLGYYDDPEQTAETLRDGWLYTGDYGYFDDDGMLYISGRKKNVIVTKNGKNIFPEEVEYYLCKSDYILEAIVYGIQDQESGATVVSADIYPDFERIKEQYGRMEEQDLRKFMKSTVEQVNDTMSMYKRVKRFEIRYTEFEKTTTKKIKRINRSGIDGYSNCKSQSEGK